MENLELFDDSKNLTDLTLGADTKILRGFALPYISEALLEIEKLQKISPFRNMVTPGGYTMSVALTNCGALGWTTDLKGYRYTSIDPNTNKPWPAMPQVFSKLANNAAKMAGFDNFAPDACLINRYILGARLSLHQDKDERNYDAPIVSVSLGMPAVFLFGGNSRNDSTIKLALYHGDVVVWGGVDRLRYHGVMPLKGEPHELLGSQRINFTFRQAG